MARLKQSIFDAPVGKVGNVIIYSVNGQHYIRAKPGGYRDKKSDAQLAQRMKMKLITDFMKRFPKLFAKTFIADSAGGYPYHAAKSYNLKHGITGEYPNLQLKKEELLISKGPIPPAREVNAGIIEGKLSLTWDSSFVGVIELKNDLVLFAVSTENHTCYHFSPVQRSEGQLLWEPEFPLPASGEVDVWIAFYRPFSQVVSDSIYCQATI